MNKFKKKKINKVNQISDNLAIFFLFFSPQMLGESKYDI